jgi:hypothetical protein
MTSNPIPAEVVEAMDVLRRQLPDLDAAAIPTKSETYVVCGRYAREVHDAIKTVLAALGPPPVDPDIEEARRLTAEDHPEYADDILAGGWDGSPGIDIRRKALKRGRELATQSKEQSNG